MTSLSAVIRALLVFSYWRVAASGRLYSLEEYYDSEAMSNNVKMCLSTVLATTSYGLVIALKIIDLDYEWVLTRFASRATSG